jgi:short-subunit dehydrogenase
MNKNLIIVGAGPGLSFGLAEKFGNEGFAVGLISRNEEKLQKQVADLKKLNITAHYASADAYDSKSLEAAILSLKNQMGEIDTLIYNAAALKMKNLMDETTEELVDDFKITVANAYHSVKILMDDLKKNKGSILLTGGAFALYPNHNFGSLSLGKAGLRSLAFQLNEALKSENIYVGTLTINGYIQHSSETHSPKILAEKFWKLHQERTEIEVIY